MEVKLWVSVMSVTCSWIFCTGLSAPAAETSAAAAAAAAAPLRHVRNKRCSCATFLDRECVYFCHLDIIWVNTPERVVSYGLGNAPRARRALTDSIATSRGGLRCRCVRETDRTCENFCLRLETAADPQRTGGTDGTDRTQVTNNRPPPPALQAAIRTRTLLGKWMKARRRHRTRAWRAESTAS